MDPASQIKHVFGVERSFSKCKPRKRLTINTVPKPFHTQKNEIMKSISFGKFCMAQGQLGRPLVQFLHGFRCGVFGRKPHRSDRSSFRGFTKRRARACFCTITPCTCLKQRTPTLKTSCRTPLNTVCRPFKPLLNYQHCRLWRSFLH